MLIKKCFVISRLFAIIFFIFLNTALYSVPIASIVIRSPGDTVCPNTSVTFRLTGSVFTDSLVLNWGDGSPTETYTVIPGNRTHVFSASSTVKLIAYEGSLTDTAKILIVVLQLPQSKFGFSYNSTACFTLSGIPVSFTDSSSGGTVPYLYFWNFGDGSSDTAKNPVHTYYSPGKYIISLSVSLKNLPQSIACPLSVYKDSLEISSDTNVISSMNINAGCPCNHILFTATGNATTWRWDFGDGDTSALQNPMHLYKRPGPYVVTLNGTGNTGCFFSKQLSFIVCSGDTLPVSKSDNNWYFGGNYFFPTFDAAGINFNPSSPVPLTNGNQEALEGCATMSDADNGTLLFYTNGINVWDNTHAVMPNGTGLFGGYSTSQTALIVPFPGNRNLYYIITGNGSTDIYKGYYYSIVDMSLNGGKGDVTTKNTVFFTGPCPEAQSAAARVSHEALSGTVKYKGDCLRPAEYWVIIPACKDTFKTFLINSAGINPPVTTVAPDNNYNGAGYSCVSPDGNKYAISQYGGGTNKIRLFDFDRNTGSLTNEKHITYYITQHSYYENFYGIAFSPNSSVLYAPFTDRLYQWNLKAANISASVYKATYADTVDMLGCNLGPDGKIYISNDLNRSSLTVINNPDVLGAGCNLVHHGFFLGGRKSKYGLQNIVPLAPTDTIKLNSSYTSTIVPCTFQVNFSDSSCRFRPDSVTTTWDYGDGTVSTYNTIQYPSHTYLNPGTYNVKMLLSKSCYFSDSVTKQIVIDPLLSFTTTAVPANCNLPNGSAAANPIGGNPSYTYSWSSGSTNQTASSLLPNTYSVTVTDIDGCTSVSTVTISNSAGPVVTLSVSAAVLCNGGTGSLSASISGGTGPYTYSWSNGTTSTSASTTNLLSGVAANTYSIVISDVNGCSGSSTVVTLTDPALLSAPTFTITKANCGLNNGTALANSTGGTGALTYSWSNAATGQSVSNLSANSYTVIVIDSNGCSQTNVISIDSVIRPIINTLSTVDPLCNGDATGIATMSVSTGAAPFTYQWSGSGGTNTSASGLTAGTYSFTLTDSVGCQVIKTVSITQPPLLVLNPNSTPDNCDSTNGTAQANASGGTGILQYNWSTGNTLSAITGLGAGTYSVTATDANNCTQFASVIVLPNNGPAANAGNDVVIATGTSTILSANGGGSYQWSPSTGLNCITCQNPTAAPTKTTTYYLTVTDVNGCTDMDSLIVTVEEGCRDDIFIPNAFSPNNDGQNDVLKIESNSCIKIMTFTIYDRWGEKVFETSNINEGWNGTFKGKPLDTDVFAFTLIVDLITNEQVMKKGNVSLLK